MSMSQPEGMRVVHKQAGQSQERRTTTTTRIAYRLRMHTNNARGLPPAYPLVGSPGCLLLEGKTGWLMARGGCCLAGSVCALHEPRPLAAAAGVVSDKWLLRGAAQYPATRARRCRWHIGITCTCGQRRVAYVGLRVTGMASMISRMVSALSRARTCSPTRAPPCPPRPRPDRAETGAASGTSRTAGAPRIACGGSGPVEAATPAQTGGVV